MKQAMDWEATMRSVDQNAKTAARLSERALSGLSQMLEQQRLHSSEMKSIAAAMKSTKDRSCPMVSDHRDPKTPEIPFPAYSTRMIAVSVVLGFIAGAGFGLFIGS